VSSDLSVRIGDELPRSIVELADENFRWEGERPPDPVPPGRQGLYLHGVSNRVTHVDFRPPTVTVTVRSGACAEDWALALGIVKRAALTAGEPVETETGPMTCEGLDLLYDEAWVRRQLEGEVRATLHIAKERGPVELPGPTRNVVFGERCAAELETGDPATMTNRFVSLSRRALWPDPRYESAAQLIMTRGSLKLKLVILVADRRCVLPPSDCVALDDGNKPFMIPRAALGELPVTTTYLDDGNQLCDAVEPARWADLCRAAQAFAIP
jgi:hypothetical protein